MVVATAQGLVELRVPRGRVSASNPHQLLVLMISTGILMTWISFVFLRNQLRPIRRLARAADAFGKGRHVTYDVAGAAEVRQAGAAFLDMRARIERQIEQRTLMLSGVSHDLRTPLTRMRLALSMMDETEDVRAMLRDVDDMQRLVDEFLNFARSDALDDMVRTDLTALVRQVIDDTARAGHTVTLETSVETGSIPLRPQAVTRALENLIGNAVRYGTCACVRLERLPHAIRIRVEDDGPGIPARRREDALKPFSRLDPSRNQNHTAGVGLGLAIASDIARKHGGRLVLGESIRLGGLCADLELAV
jgi:two-component system osmolarity sensor histidine kinase EnvZ